LYVQFTPQPEFVMVADAPFQVGQAVTLRNLAKWRNDPALARYIGQHGTVKRVARASKGNAAWTVIVEFPWPEAPIGPRGVRTAWATDRQVVAL
jgi:hypothetical protein